ncbi:hypothetical protein ACFQ0M_00210 [Kitasatospora aburaviensis]|uniref:Protein-L-isoaspartate O-methyltransferase n=1 Tax=Kitasatospora aburaviensis TaxID=67265 RepID=A0ABW1F144_9ACTN
MATGKSRPVDRTADEACWLAAAAADIPIGTQWDEGEHQGAEPASMPSLVASMLDDLQAEPGMRVLEQGTGTGWTAALLAHRLGDANVTTPEIRHLIGTLFRRPTAPPNRLLAWSTWRRLHQAQARCCHYRRRGV